MAKAEAAAAKWVAVRLAQRYSNGTMLSYSARAIAHDEVSVCVLVKEEFETGMGLSIMAPFLNGLTTARVFSVTRSTNQPGYFEVFLQIGEDASSTVGLRASVKNRELGKGSNGRGSGADTREGIAAPQNASKQSAEVPEVAAEAAKNLAYELGKLPARRLSEVLQELPSELRSMSLLVAVAAAIHLLEKKGHIQARGLISRVAAAPREVVKQ